MTFFYYECEAWSEQRYLPMNHAIIKTPINPPFDIKTLSIVLLAYFAASVVASAVE